MIPRHALSARILHGRSIHPDHLAIMAAIADLPHCPVRTPALMRAAGLSQGAYDTSEDAGRPVTPDTTTTAPSGQHSAPCVHNER